MVITIPPPWQPCQLNIQAKAMIGLESSVAQLM